MSLLFLTVHLNEPVTGPYPDIRWSTSDQIGVKMFLSGLVCLYFCCSHWYTLLLHEFTLFCLNAAWKPFHKHQDCFMFTTALRPHFLSEGHWEPGLESEILFYCFLVYIRSCPAVWSFCCCVLRALWCSAQAGLKASQSRDLLWHRLAEIRWMFLEYIV